MSACYFIRCARSGHPGRFVGADELQRGDLVVVRTRRGVELGEVLGLDPTDQFTPLTTEVPVGTILRKATGADLETRSRLDFRSIQDFDRCVAILSDEPRESSITVIDVDWTLDAECMLVYYLGEDDNIALGSLETRLGNAFACEVLMLHAVTETESEGKSVPANAANSCCSSSGGCCSKPRSEKDHGCQECSLRQLLSASR